MTRQRLVDRNAVEGRSKYRVRSAEAGWLREAVEARRLIFSVEVGVDRQATCDAWGRQDRSGFCALLTAWIWDCSHMCLYRLASCTKQIYNCLPVIVPVGYLRPKCPHPSLYPHTLEPRPANQILMSGINTIPGDGIAFLSSQYSSSSHESIQKCAWLYQSDQGQCDDNLPKMPEKRYVHLAFRVL